MKQSRKVISKSPGSKLTGPRKLMKVTKFTPTHPHTEEYKLTMAGTNDSLVESRGVQGSITHAGVAFQ